jgi:iron complex transport system substrate-binding protein
MIVFMSRGGAWPFVLVAALISIGLAQPGTGSAESSRTTTVSDDAGKRVTVPTPPQRIVSLAPGATEMLFSAGAGEHVIATVEYSDEPAEARRVSRIGDVTAVDMERLVALHPDVVVVWPGGGNPAQIEKLSHLGIPVYRQQVNSLSDLPVSLRRLGALTGTSVTADRAARDLETRLARLSREYGTHTSTAVPPHDGANAGKSNPGRAPTVLLEIWNRPIYTVGGTHLMSDALRLCGARNVFGDLRDLGPVVDIEAVIARNPDIIVAFAPPGEGATWLADWKRFGNVNAVRSGRLIAFEDQRLTRLGPSVVDATESLCKKLATATRSFFQ